MADEESGISIEGLKTTFVAADAADVPLEAPAEPPAKGPDDGLRGTYTSVADGKITVTKLPPPKDAAAPPPPDAAKPPEEPATPPGRTQVRPAAGYVRNWERKDGNGIKTWLDVPQETMGDSFNMLIELLRVLLCDPEMFPSMVEMMFPKDKYTDPVERERRVSDFKDVITNPDHPDRNLPMADLIRKHFTHLSTGKETLLRPDLLKKLSEPGPTAIKSYVNTTLEAVDDYNKHLAPGQMPLDPNLVLNQIFQESHFNPEAVGPQTKYGRAYGIAQFLPETAAKYGLSQADLMDPSKALPAAVKHIGELTQKYGDQRLAMVSYNGGHGAVDWVADELNKPIAEVTINDWMGYAEFLNNKYGKGAPNLWRNQTHDYVAVSHSDYWPPEKCEEAARLMKELGIAVPGEKPPATLVASATDTAAPPPGNGIS